MTEAAGVVIISAEDGVADTIKPRVMAAGGDPSRILFLDTVSEGADGERLLSLPKDVPIIERAVRRVAAKLLIIDPLMAFMSPKLDPYKDQDVRQALTPVKLMAEDTGAAVVIVRHFIKDSDKKALHRGGGSIGIVGVARSGLLVAEHPEDESRRVLAPFKSNLAKLAPSLEFELAEADNGAVKVEWGERTSLGADALLAAHAPSSKPSALDEAKEFVQKTLKGRAVLSTRLEEKALSSWISKPTLRRAKEALGVIAKKGGTGPWWSVLPDTLAEEEGALEDDQEERTTQDEHLEHLGAEEQVAEDEDAQGAQDNHLLEPEQLVRCIHDFPHGKGCYLCDPDHPYRRN